MSQTQLSARFKGPTKKRAATPEDSSGVVLALAMLVLAVTGGALEEDEAAEAWAVDEFELDLLWRPWLLERDAVRHLVSRSLITPE